MRGSEYAKPIGELGLRGGGGGRGNSLPQVKEKKRFIV